jgi:glutathione S-transferase
MDQLAAQLASSGGPFMLGDKLTVADLVAKYFLLDMITSGNFDHVPKEYVEAWPSLVALDSAIQAHPILQVTLSPCAFNGTRTCTYIWCAL